MGTFVVVWKTALRARDVDDNLAVLGFGSVFERGEGAE